MRLILCATAVLLSLSLLGGCSSRKLNAAPTTVVQVPTAAANPTPALRSRYNFEAERTAMNQGCLGPNRSRPAAKVVRQQDTMEWFEVACEASVQKVRCDMGMCVPTN